MSNPTPTPAALTQAAMDELERLLPLVGSWTYSEQHSMAHCACALLDAPAPAAALTAAELHRIHEINDAAFTRSPGWNEVAFLTGIIYRLTAAREADAARAKRLADEVERLREVLKSIRGTAGCHLTVGDPLDRIHDRAVAALAPLPPQGHPLGGAGGDSSNQD